MKAFFWAALATLAVGSSFGVEQIKEVVIKEERVGRGYRYKYEERITSTHASNVNGTGVAQTSIRVSSEGYVGRPDQVALKAGSRGRMTGAPSRHPRVLPPWRNPQIAQHRMRAEGRRGAAGNSGIGLKVAADINRFQSTGGERGLLPTGHGGGFGAAADGVIFTPPANENDIATSPLHKDAPPGFRPLTLPPVQTKPSPRPQTNKSRAVSGSIQQPKLRPVVEASGSAYDESDSLLDYQRTHAEMGNPQSQFAMGIRYLNGIGVQQDEKHAREWLARASAQGNLNARAKLRQLAAEDTAGR